MSNCSWFFFFGKTSLWCRIGCGWQWIIIICLFLNGIYRRLFYILHQPIDENQLSFSTKSLHCPLYTHSSTHTHTHAHKRINTFSEKSFRMKHTMNGSSEWMNELELMIKIIGQLLALWLYETVCFVCQNRFKCHTNYVVRHYPKYVKTL